MPPLLARRGDERQAVGALLVGGRTCSIHPAGALAGGASPLFARQRGRAGRDTAELLGRFPTTLSYCCPGKSDI